MRRYGQSRRAVAAVAAVFAMTYANGAEHEVDQPKRPWAKSPHGAMLERILPPAMQPGNLPEPQSAGARLTARYCVQCHYLVNPAMHTPERWKSVVERMVWRMRGNGNMGEVMKELMAQVRAPTDAEVDTLLTYLQKHGQSEIDPRHPSLTTRAGEAFAIACSQCHALPDPQRHTAREWPIVVERMKHHMAWTNRIVGSPELKTTPELNSGEIVGFLQRYAKRER
jgi:cytochrome c2